MTRQRLVANTALLISVLYLPWWITVALAVVGLFSFNRFFELIIFMLVIDLLYGAPGAGFWSYPFLFSSAAVLALPIVESAKKRFRI